MRNARTGAAGAHLANRSGFALPLALLAIILFTVLLAASYSRIAIERRVNDNQQAQVDAFAIAQSGLERFVVQREALGFVAPPSAAAESARVELPRGYADVVLQQLRAAVGPNPALYAVRSRGVRRGLPHAERTVARYAEWQTIKVLAGWTSLTGLHKNGDSGMLSGNDACGVEAPVAGVAVPTGRYSGHDEPASGSPPISHLGTQEQAADAVKIDWEGIVNGDALSADITIPGGAWPSSFPADYWPVIRVNGNFSLPTDGQGILIVTGDLTINGSKTWRGVVLVGRTLGSDGDNTVRGATITGLNVKLGPPYPPPSDIGSGNKTYQYDSCAIAAAAAKFARLVPHRNAWTDNWATY